MVLLGPGFVTNNLFALRTQNWEACPSLLQKQFDRPTHAEFRHLHMQSSDNRPNMYKVAMSTSLW